MSAHSLSSGPIRAVLFDFGGVILTSPFEAFNRYEASAGLPKDLVRSINATNPNTNAWSKLERNEVALDEFAALFEAEAAALGHTVSGRTILELLDGDPRPQMVEALRRIRAAGFRTAMLTNNFRRDDAPARDFSHIYALFEVIIESRVVGIRKPDPAFYRRACDDLAIEPHEAVFLDDLGINLKPAAAMGMRTIKVVDPDDALRELEVVLGIELR